MERARAAAAEQAIAADAAWRRADRSVFEGRNRLYSSTDSTWRRH